MSKPEYTYKPPAPSFLFANVLNPFYDKVVLLYPRCWTPNAITVFGIVNTLTASALILGALSQNKESEAFGAFDRVDALFPSADAFESPSSANQFLPRKVESWLLILSGVLNLVYCIADNTDGKQARRWKMSSPIGEYLDHGLDCVTSLLSTACLVVCAGLSLHAAAFALLIVAFITTMSHTLNLRRNIFIWGTEWASVDEAMIAFGVVPILAGVWPDFTSATLAFAGYPHIRFVDVGLAGFLFSQVTMAYTICQHLWSLWVDPLVVTQGLLMLGFGYTAYRDNGGVNFRFAAQSGQVEHYFNSHFPEVIAAVPQIRDVFTSYSVLWFVTAACCASIIVHVPIGAKCVMKTAGSNTPSPQVWPRWVAASCFAIFTAKPWLGAVLAVVAHNVQMLSNIRSIIETKRRVDATAVSDKKAE